MLTNMKRPVHHRFACSAENIDIASESVAEDPNVSISRLSQELWLSYSTLQLILHLNLHLYPYKVQLTQQLKPFDHSQRRRFVEWVLEQQEVEGNFSNKIFFSNEAHFILGRYVSKQNCCIWSSENLPVIEEKPLHSDKVALWYDLWSEGVIGSYFLETDDCHHLFGVLQLMITDY